MLDQLSHSTLQQWMDMTIGIAQQGGSILKHFWGRIQDIKEKGFPGDLVTEADRQSEEVIVHGIRRHFPGHAILAEESGHIEGQADFSWIVDPLDGTTNYAHQYPLVAISIGLLYQQEPILGVIYNPIQEELFHAYQGSGAFLNGCKLSVSQIPSLGKSLLATGFAYDRCQNPNNNYTEFCHFTHLTQGVRRGGAASLDLAYVAAGRLDGYWERGLKPWDMAAGIVIVKEAGGQVSDYDGSLIKLDSGRILATNGLLHEAIKNELLQLKPDRLAD